MSDTPSSSASGMGADHERIWLEPMAPVYGCEGRQWCQDKVWPDCDGDPEPTEYIRADLHRHALSAKDRELAEARAEIGELKDRLKNSYFESYARELNYRLAAENETKRAERARDEALSALRPFVEEFEARRESYIRRYPRNPGVGAANFDAMPDDWMMDNSTFTMGQYRRARSVITPVSREQRGEEA